MRGFFLRIYMSINKERGPVPPSNKAQPVVNEGASDTPAVPPAHESLVLGLVLDTQAQSLAHEGLPVGEIDRSVYTMEEVFSTIPRQNRSIYLKGLKGTTFNRSDKNLQPDNPETLKKA